MAEPESPQDRLARLEFAFRVRAFHHNAIWEEQKHFTWFMPILLSAQLFALTSDKIDSTTKALLTVIAGFVGVTLAATGLLVQRREGSYYRNATELFVVEHNAVFPDRQIPLPPHAANRAIGALLISFVTGKAGVRDYFQILFLAFAAVFIALGALGVVGA